MHKQILFKSIYLSISVNATNLQPVEKEMCFIIHDGNYDALKIVNQIKSQNIYATPIGEVSIANWFMYNNVAVSEFELQSLYYIYFRTNAFVKVMDSLIPLAMG